MNTRLDTAKIIRDPIHGDLKLDQVVRRFICLPHFQRLRRIAQNGFLSSVFPGMQHTRFEHSLGAAYLAQQRYDIIINSRFLDAALDEKDQVEAGGNLILECRTTMKTISELRDNTTQQGPRWRAIVTVAALCHDVGHGPFSRAFEEMCSASNINPVELLPLETESVHIGKFLESLRPTKENPTPKRIRHEDFSLACVDRLFRDADLAGTSLLKTDAILVAALIHDGFRHHMLSLDETSPDDTLRLHLFAPLISGLIDVDRMDYLARDARMAGVPYGAIDLDRLCREFGLCLATEHNKTISVTITQSRNVHMLDHFLVCLYEMYIQILFHPAGLRIQHEISEILRPDLQDTITENSKDGKGFDWYLEMSDESFLKSMGAARAKMCFDVIARRVRDGGKVSHQIFGEPQGLVAELKNAGWEKLTAAPRELIKGKGKVMIYDLFPDGSSERLRFLGWETASLIATKLADESYTPSVWWRNEKFTDELKKLNAALSNGSQGKIVDQAKDRSKAAGDNV